MTVADRIGVMNHGQLVQVAPPRTLYEAPNSRWVAGFVGNINMIEGQVISRSDGVLTVAAPAAGQIMAAGETAAKSVCIAIRPEKIGLSRIDGGAMPGKTNTFGATLREVSYLGGVSMIRLALDAGAELRVAVSNASRSVADDFAAGQRVTASFAPHDCVVLDS